MRQGRARGPDVAHHVERRTPASQSSSSQVLPASDLRAAPTLLTSTSSPPKRPAASHRACRAAAVARSAATPIGAGAPDRLLGRVGHGAPASRPPTATRAPARASRRGGQTDPGRAAGDQAGALLETEVRPRMVRQRVRGRATARHLTGGPRGAGGRSRRLVCDHAASDCLVRHGETAWNARAPLAGHRDVPLTALGEAQAQRGGRLCAWSRARGALASPLIRSLGDGRADRQAGLRPRAGVPARGGRSTSAPGRADGSRTRPSATPRASSRWQTGVTGWTDGETYAAMSERVLRRARAPAARLRGPTRAIVIVTHGGPIRASCRTSWSCYREGRARFLRRRTPRSRWSTPPDAGARRTTTPGT